MSSSSSSLTSSSLFCNDAYSKLAQWLPLTLWACAPRSHDCAAPSSCHEKLLHRSCQCHDRFASSSDNWGRHIDSKTCKKTTQGWRSTWYFNFTCTCKVNHSPFSCACSHTSSITGVPEENWAVSRCGHLQDFRSQFPRSLMARACCIDHVPQLEVTVQVLRSRKGPTKERLSC